MSRTLLLILFLLLSPCAGCFARHYTQEQNNLIKENKIPDPYTWDFGRVKEGEVLKHSFTLKNESAKTLTIKEVNTSCGCTASEARKKTLLPAEDTLIEVSFNTKGYSGPVQQYIYVHTDNHDNPIIRFIIKAEVVKK